MVKYIWIKGKRLYYYDTYKTWKDALNQAKYHQKRLHNNYFILKTESSITGNIIYKLYMNKVIGLFR